MKVLVTGATGLLGNNVVRQLLDASHHVRVLVRKNSSLKTLEGLDVEIFTGDVSDSDAVDRAMKGMDTVIHSAAFVFLGWSQLEKSRRVNVLGTRNVARSANRREIKMIHVSSVDTLAVGSFDEPSDETTRRDDKVPCSYVVSKREAERVVFDEIRAGLQAIVVHPGFLLGPWDWRPSSGQMMVEVGRRFTPAAPRGGCCLADVRDAARGVLLASEHGRLGRNYILGGHNISYFDLWRRISRVSRTHQPMFRLLGPGAFVGGFIGDLKTKLTGQESAVNSAAIGLAKQVHFYSSQRAIDELGYSVRSVEETIDDAWNWFSEYGYV